MSRVAARRASFVVTVVDDAGEEWSGDLVVRPPLVEGLLSTATGERYHRVAGKVYGSRSAGGLVDGAVRGITGLVFAGAPSPAVWATIGIGAGELPFDIEFTGDDWSLTSERVDAVELESAAAGWLRSYLQDARAAVDGVAGHDLPAPVRLATARLFLALGDLSSAERAIHRALPGLRRSDPGPEDVDAGRPLVEVLPRFHRSSLADDLRRALRL